MDKRAFRQEAMPICAHYMVRKDVGNYRLDDHRLWPKDVRDRYERMALHIRDKDQLRAAKSIGRTLAKYMLWTDHASGHDAHPWTNFDNAVDMRYCV